MRERQETKTFRKGMKEFKGLVISYNPATIGLKLLGKVLEVKEIKMIQKQLYLEVICKALDA